MRSRERRAYAGIDKWVNTHDKEYMEPDVDLLIAAQARRDGIKSFDPKSEEAAYVRRKEEKAVQEIQSINQMAGFRAHVIPLPTSFSSNTTPSTASLSYSEISPNNTFSPSPAAAASLLSPIAQLRAKKEKEKLESAPLALSSEEESTSEPIRLTQFDSVSELMAAHSSDALREELMRQGLKSGGSHQQRADRLWLLKVAGNASKLPSKLIAESVPVSKQVKVASSHSYREGTSQSFHTEFKHAGGRKPAQGPLYKGMKRVPGQKSLPEPPGVIAPRTKKPKTTPALPRADNFGPLLN